MSTYPTVPHYSYDIKCQETTIAFPPQHQLEQPGMEYLMDPRPIFDNPKYKGSNKLKNKVAIITGGDSGIGRSVSIHFAKEGANVVIVYYNEEKDAEETKDYIKEHDGKCLLIKGDLSTPSFSKKIVEKTLDKFDKINILINNHAIQYPQNSILDISNEQLKETFETNIFSFFYLTKAVLPYLKEDDTIINTTSITAYRGSEHLIDYASTKGAIVAFTKSLANSLIHQGIRVNAVAPGPVWTPLIPSSFDAESVSTFGIWNPMHRAAQPFELAPTYVMLANSNDSKFINGQIIHINGGEYS